jgi:RNA polymerase sigma factor (sigma-70 family)
MTPHAGQAPWLDEFTTSYRDLLRFLRRRTRCDDTARDLAQDAWLRVSAQQAGGNPSAPPPATQGRARAYLFTVAEHLAIDHLRRQRHWHEELAPRLLAGPQHVPDVAESHAYTQALSAVDRALTGMPSRMREVFVAHRLEGVPHDELAQRFQVSRKTIEREVTRAMDLAQAALDEGPAKKPAHDAAGSQQAPARHGRRKALGALLGLAGVGTSGTLAWQCWGEWVPQWQSTFATRAGHTGRLPLPDGSELTLNADSIVDVRLLATRREVTLLRGGAFFAVARDATRPFVVLAGDARVTVLGTRFAVEMDARGTSVAVASGRVSVHSASGPVSAEPGLELGPGETARVDHRAMPVRTSARPVDAVAPWRSGWLDLDRLPLAEAAAQLNRYRPGALVTVDPAVAALPVFGRVNIARSTQWLQGLPSVLPVKVGLAADGGMTIRPRE